MINEERIIAIAKNLAKVTIESNREYISSITKGLNNEQLKAMCTAMAFVAVKNNANEILMDYNN